MDFLEQHSLFGLKFNSYFLVGFYGYFYAKVPKTRQKYAFLHVLQNFPRDCSLNFIWQILTARNRCCIMSTIL